MTATPPRDQSEHQPDDCPIAEAISPIHPDRLTILRLLLLTAGVAVGLGVFLPRSSDPWDINTVLVVGNALVLGLALPAPLFTLRFGRRRERPLGPGGLFALTVGLGGLLMLPPALASVVSPKPGSAAVCLYYAMPLVGLWYLLAAALAGHVNRALFRPATPWVERYGLLLAALWSPLGAWHLANFYLEAF
ncbi:MAG: hypothetical protein GXY83_05565 [Rhodopirellula sp.]|nr:hypothetical protein [Rhodopirellula sp.]